MGTTNRLIAVCISAALGLGAQQAGAAGFGLFEQSVSGLGNAFAGGAAAAEDASTIYFNPAGMSRLGNAEFVGGAHFISPSTTFKDRGSRTAAAFGGARLTGGDGGDGGVDALVPNLYYARAVNDRWTAGLGISVPFGLSTDYDDGWVGRYHALGSDLRTINVNPAVAFRVSPRWSVGFGVNAMYADLKEFSNAVDSFGTCASIVRGGVANNFGMPFDPTNVAMLGAFNTGLGTTCAPAGLTGPANAGTDSHAELEGDDWGYGFNVGILFQPDSRTRIGFAYRSKVELEVDGNADFTVHPGLATVIAGNGLPLLQDTGFKADLTLPEIVSISSYQVLNDEWALMGDITWTGWSRFESLVARFDNGAPNLVVPEDWDDTFRVALGMTYTASPRWKWRFGAAYDQAAATRNDRVSPRIPDDDRTWLTAGFSYLPWESVNVDVGYAHLFLPNRKVRLADPTTGHMLVGEFDSSVDILSAQLRWIF